MPMSLSGTDGLSTKVVAFLCPIEKNAKVKGKIGEMVEIFI